MSLRTVLKTLKKGTSFDAAWWEDYSGACNFVPLVTFGAFMNKKPYPDLWAIDLNLEVTA